MPDHPRGYVRRGKGILPPDAEMAGRYERRAKHERVVFDQQLQRILIDGTRDICDRRGWRVHQVAVVSSHLHALVSWRDEAVGWQFVRDTLKRLLGWMLAKRTEQKGRRWFVRGGSRRRVRERGHFEFHMSEYLPRHFRGRRGGTGWDERVGYVPAK